MYMSMPLHSRVQYSGMVKRKGSCVAKHAYINNNSLWSTLSAKNAANY